MCHRLRRVCCAACTTNGRSRRASWSRVLEGEVYDVAVDIRRGSAHFGRWTAVILSAANKRHFWIPEGFAHGFAVLSERAIFSYLCTAHYDREADASLRWNDAQSRHRLAAQRARAFR
jgi:dTDP-4-dehydrorhamnose 3,5-epimerase